jgi:hypothetical protein
VVVSGQDSGYKMKRSAKRGRYEVHTNPDLYNPERPVATRLLKVAIVLAMCGILIALHRPLISAVKSALP